MIFKDKCIELGLPEPKDYETDESYILRTIANGHVLNTRMCCYCGIFYLHSIVPKIHEKKYEFTWGLGLAKCEFTHKTPRREVIIIYMTKEQQEQYRNEKAAMA